MTTAHGPRRLEDLSPGEMRLLMAYRTVVSRSKEAAREVGETVAFACDASIRAAQDLQRRWQRL
jgi:hypothetical protein